MIEKLTNVIQSEAVRWEKPEVGWFKLNIDGFGKRNPGSADGRGIIRDHRGEMIKAFAKFYGQCTNNVAEAYAILKGIKICSRLSLFNVVVESDFLLIINMISKQKKTSWKVAHIIEQIWQALRTGKYKFKHTLREGNCTTDILANLGEESKEYIFNEFVSLPLKVRASIKLKLDGIPNFRFRTKNKKYVYNGT